MENIREKGKNFFQELFFSKTNISNLLKTVQLNPIVSFWFTNVIADNYSISRFSF
jgi:hypothetical protein